MVDQLPPSPETMMMVPPPADMPLIDRVIDALLAFKSVISGQPRLPIEDLGPDMRRKYEAHALRLLGHIANAPPVVTVEAERIEPFSTDVRVTALMVSHIWHLLRIDDYQRHGMSGEYAAKMYVDAITARLDREIFDPVSEALTKSRLFNPPGR